MKYLILILFVATTPLSYATTWTNSVTGKTWTSNDSIFSTNISMRNIYFSSNNNCNIKWDESWEKPLTHYTICSSNVTLEVKWKPIVTKTNDTWYIKFQESKADELPTTNINGRVWTVYGE